MISSSVGIAAVIIGLLAVIVYLITKKKSCDDTITPFGCTASQFFTNKITCPNPPTKLPTCNSNLGNNDCKIADGCNYFDIKNSPAGVCLYNGTGTLPNSDETCLDNEDQSMCNQNDYCSWNNLDKPICAPVVSPSNCTHDGLCGIASTYCNADCNGNPNGNFVEIDW